MTVRKFLLSIFLVLYLVGFSQEKTKYPKDTIYVKYEVKENETWNNKFERKFHKEMGIYFNIVTKNGDIALFASYKSNFDTLNIKNLKNFKFSDLKEINRRWNDWIISNKRPPANRNGVFQTYVIEKINENCIVKYPVIWRNEGVTD